MGIGIVVENVCFRNDRRGGRILRLYSFIVINKNFISEYY